MSCHISGTAVAGILHVVRLSVPHVLPGAIEGQQGPWGGLLNFALVVHPQQAFGQSGAHSHDGSPIPRSATSRLCIRCEQVLETATSLLCLDETVASFIWDSLALPS